MWGCKCSFNKQVYVYTLNTSPTHSEGNQFVIFYSSTMCAKVSWREELKHMLHLPDITVLVLVHKVCWMGTKWWAYIVECVWL